MQQFIRLNSNKLVIFQSIGQYYFQVFSFLHGHQLFCEDSFTTEESYAVVTVENSCLKLHWFMRVQGCGRVPLSVVQIKVGLPSSIHLEVVPIHKGSIGSPVRLGKSRIEVNCQHSWLSYLIPEAPHHYSLHHFQAEHQAVKVFHSSSMLRSSVLRLCD